MSEAVWDKAFTQGSKELQARLRKVHAKNPKFQAWLQSSGHGTETSVKQASKEVKPSARVRKLQTKSLQAYGATKGAKVGGEHGSEEMRDTIVPLTRDQHSKVQAAERAAKAAAKAAAPAKPKKPLSKAERMAVIARAATRAKSKDRFDVPTVNPDDMDHDDLRDVHNQMHIRGTYSEATDRIALIKAVASKNKMNTPPKLKKKPDSVKKMIGRHKYVSYIDDVTGYTTKAKEKGINRFEEVEQIDELKVKTYTDYISATYGDSPAAQARKLGGPKNPQRNLGRYRAKRLRQKQIDKPEYQKMLAQSRPQDSTSGTDRGYGQGRYMGDSVNLEGSIMNEVTKKEAEQTLGGPVKEKPTMPPGKQPAGYRYVRGLARKAMKAGLKKEEVEQIHEDHEDEYAKHMDAHIDAANAGKWDKAEMHAKKAEAAAAKHFKATGEKIRDIGYTGDSPHIIAEAIKDAADVGEYDYEGDMAKSQLRSILTNAKRLHDMLEDTTNLPEWVQSKITLAEDYILTAANYMEGEMNEEVEQVDEVKAVKAYDKEGKLVGRYRSMDHAKQMKPGHTYKVEEGVVSEAEGTVAVTPKEKALAAHHGDPKKITYGDVIKARIKSAAEKAMKKGN